MPLTKRIANGQLFLWCIGFYLRRCICPINGNVLLFRFLFLWLEMLLCAEALSVLFNLHCNCRPWDNSNMFCCLHSKRTISYSKSEENAPKTHAAHLHAICSACVHNYTLYYSHTPKQIKKNAVKCLTAIF